MLVGPRPRRAEEKIGKVGRVRHHATALVSQRGAEKEGNEETSSYPVTVAFRMPFHQIVGLSNSRPIRL
jgi:hypothetical protein